MRRPIRRCGCVLDHVAVFDVMLDGVEPEPIDAHLGEPEVGNVVQFGRNGLILEVEVRHAFPKETEVVAIACLVPRRAGLAAPQVPVDELRPLQERGTEPGVGFRRVVEDEVDDDGDSSLVGLVDQCAEDRVVSVLEVDASVIGDVVSVITGALHDRHEPDASHTEIVGCGLVAVVEVVEPVDEPLEVADSVSVRVLETPHEHLIEDPIVPPWAGCGRSGCGRAVGLAGCRRQRSHRRGGSRCGVAARASSQHETDRDCQDEALHGGECTTDRVSVIPNASAT